MLNNTFNKKKEEAIAAVKDYAEPIIEVTKQEKYTLFCNKLITLVSAGLENYKNHRSSFRMAPQRKESINELETYLFNFSINPIEDIGKESEKLFQLVVRHASETQKSHQNKGCLSFFSSCIGTKSALALTYQQVLTQLAKDFPQEVAAEYKKIKWQAEKTPEAKLNSRKSKNEKVANIRQRLKSVV